ncbi:Uncharacterised protein [Klebsiella pneumoniae]|nr:Uncharacterised protein [Klebsiella pneumoniae]
MLAALGALDVFAPFVGDDLRLDTDLRPIVLQHFRHQLGVGVVGALYRHGPQGDLGAFGDAGLLQQLPGLGRIVGRVLDGLVVGPLGRRHAVARQLAGALVDGVDDGLLVHRHVQRLAYFQLVERLVGDVVGDVAEVEAGLRRQVQVRVLLQRVEVGGARVEGDLALAGLELLRAHRGVGVDSEDQVVDLHLVRLPVVLVALEADLRILLVAAEHERAGADRLLVDVAGLALLEQLRGVFGGLDRWEGHRQVLDEGRVDLVEGELHRMLVELLDPGDVLVQAHVGEVGKLGGVGLAERMILVEHAFEGEQHVVGIEFAGRLEVVGTVELHALAQVEGIGLAVVADVPAFREAGKDLGAAALELGQAVEDGFRRGVEIGTGGVLGGIEAGRAAFRAEDQVAGEGLGSGGDQRCAEQRGNDRGADDGVSTHGVTSGYFDCLRGTAS